MVNFIKKQRKTEYTASHCAGASLPGEAGIADGKQVVTYCGGSEALQNDYPNVLVQDDNVNAVVTDGNIISSNGQPCKLFSLLGIVGKNGWNGTKKTRRKRIINT
ncbi:MAG: hypothetical protein R2821_07100 [Flavobacteriaceae bacterium]